MSGSGQTYLTSAEVEHLIDVSKGSFTQEQILLLYKRFRTLDKAKRGYLQSSDLVNSIPELSINPLNKRIAYFCDGMNFKEFVRLLAPYSPKASQGDKVRALFAVWDVNGDGRVCKEDVALVLREAGGTNLMEDEMRVVLERLFEGCEGKLGRRIGAEGMTVGEFEHVLGDFALDLGVDFNSL